MKQLTAAVLGFGDRGQIYSKYSLQFPKKLKIVAIVEPNKLRLENAKKLFNLPDNMCFLSYNDFIKKGKIADFVINATMDKLHIQTAMPLLKLGYDVLLEKPISSDKEELLNLLKEKRKYNNKIIVCHVLRYTPFYRGIKELILKGEIGEVRHIETSENVGVAHASISYIRGKWKNSKECGSSYMMAKCCHDFDLLCWLNNKTVPNYISSFGSREYFVPQKAPEGAGTRCLVDCMIEKECRYSAYKMHILNDPMGIDVWNCIDKLPEDITMEEKIESLKTINDHGLCIYKTNADIVDQQMAQIIFKDGSTAYHSLISSVARAGRRIKVYGTKGEIEGFSEDNCFYLRQYTPENISYKETKFDVSKELKGDGHHGGDSRIMHDLINVFNGKEPSISTTSLEDSIYSHLCVIAADESMNEKKILDINML